MEHFKRNISVKDSLDLGITSKMWFGMKRKSIEYNDGDRDFYLSESFGKKILKLGQFRQPGAPDLYFIPNLFTGHWRWPKRKVFFSFRLADFGDGFNTKGFYTRMRSGKYGWNSEIGTRKYKIPKRSRRALYKQLYDHFLTKL